MTSRRVPGLYPPPGTSALADNIRQRRGVWGLTGLDAALLHLPALAEAWNGIGRALRNEGKLPDDVREAMILRVGAHNDAAFEWMQHEDLGRAAGFTTAQLRTIRDISTPSVPGDLFTPLQFAAIQFADKSTKEIRVSDDVFENLKTQFQKYVQDKDGDDAKKDESVQELLVEAAAVVGCYNMVSRFLMSLDIAAMSDTPPAWPADRQERKIILPSSTSSSPQYLHVITLTADPSYPWILLSNCLLTNHTLWAPLLPYFSKTYNIIMYDQRGHGQSSVPSPPITTLGDLTSDIPIILSAIPGVSLPIHSIIGVAQGGATALNSLRLSATISKDGKPRLSKSVIACSIHAISPETNVRAWDDRISLAYTTPDGMSVLAKETTRRWFPSSIERMEKNGILKDVAEMISNTDKRGLEAGARSLQGYNLIDPNPEIVGDGPALLEVRDIPTLLIAGGDDTQGTFAAGLRNLADMWMAKGAKQVKYVCLEGCGHLLMLERTRDFANVVLEFLEEVK